MLSNSPDNHNKIINNEVNIEINWNLIEKKWLDYWRINKINESDIDDTKKKFFITVAYPYPNSPQHIGHGRTYTLADVHARFYKLKGYNVLFPMGFHYTGTPILGMSKRVQNKDKELINNFKNIFAINENIINSFIDPINIAKYFHNEIKYGMIEMGFAIDWRREFTTIDPIYKKFISWQFKTLHGLGVIEQGSHPVGWCPNDGNPVSQHDTQGDVEPSFTEYTMIKFKLKDENVFLPVATLRPETIYGVTNLWINNKEKYSKVKVNNNETWIISDLAARKLKFQNFKIETISEVNSIDLVEQLVENPFNDSIIPILPASFVTMDDGSGIVMSVPAHAPFDMQALIDIKKSNDFLKIDINNVIPIVIIDTDVDTIKLINKVNQLEEDNNISIPSLIFLKKYKIQDQNDINLEKATSDLYNFEFYHGQLNHNTPYENMPILEIKEKVRDNLLKSNDAIIYYELTNKPVYCRCGTLCVVKILDNQWFLNYGNKKWKEIAFKCLHQMDIIPHEIIGEFENVFDWLKERACARKSGLGTLLPWDKSWIIESLSDSVIYMIYYIIAKYVNIHNLEDYNDFIDDSFFDFIIYNKKTNNFKKLEDAESHISINDEKNKDQKGKNSLPHLTDSDQLKNFLRLSGQIKQEFEYFYPLDSRHSGRDLIPNHLSFFIFNHSILFPETQWPKQIVVNGSVLMDGKKMSKSIGNIIPLRTAIKQYSADSIRVAMLVLGELLQDVDFSFATLKGIYSKLNEMYNFYRSFYNTNKWVLDTLIDSTEKEIVETIIKKEILNMEDKWILTRINYNIYTITNAFEKLKIRESLNTALYLMDRDFEWYKKRKFAKYDQLYKNKIDIVIIYIYLINKMKILAPFCPFICEELWHLFGNDYSIFTTSLPRSEMSKIEDDLNEENEQFISTILNDINKIKKITKNTNIDKIFIYLASENKIYLYSEILKIFINNPDKSKNFGEIMKTLLAQTSDRLNLQYFIKNNIDFIKKTVDDILSLSPHERERRNNIGRFEEDEPISDSISLLSHEFDIPQDNIIIFKEDHSDIIDPGKKAKFSRPYKPAIFLQ